MIGPYEAVSIEAMQTITLASEAILKSREIKKEVISAIDHTHRLQQAAHESVNENIIKKIAQTITITVSMYNCRVWPSMFGSTLQFKQLLLLNHLKQSYI